MKLFVWDFHGVLERGNEYAVRDISNLVLERFGYAQRLSLDDCLLLGGRKWHEYFAHVLPSERHARHLELEQEGYAYAASHEEVMVKYVRPADHASEVLARIRAAGHTQLLLSHTTDDGIAFFLRCVGLDGFFPAGHAIAICNDGHDGLSKEAALRQFLSGKDFERIIIVGDSPSDIALAGVGGGATYLYAHPGVDFKECDADYRIRDLREVLKEV
jgi:phosphoglycolate phosphatase-like HAD superfamily hydrolase